MPRDRDIILLFQVLLVFRLLKPPYRLNELLDRIETRPLWLRQQSWKGRDDPGLGPDRGLAGRSRAPSPPCTCLVG